MSEQDNIPPHNLDAERAVLGCLLIEGKEAVARVADRLVPEDFYTEAHRIVIRWMLAMIERGEAIDIITLTDALRDGGELEAAGGPAAIARLEVDASVLVYLDKYIRIIREQSDRRRIIQLAQRLEASALEKGGPTDALLEMASAEISTIEERKHGGIVTPPQFAARLASMSTIEPIRVGLSVLDDQEAVVSGYTTLIAARPGLGKTALGVQVVRNMAVTAGVPTLFVSVEMSLEQIGARALNQLTGISIADIRHQRYPAGALDARIRQIAESGFHIQADGVSSVGAVVAAIRRGVRQHGIKLAIIDHLHLLEASKRDKSRQEDIAGISRTLRLVAKDLKLPIIVLAQLNRAIEGRPEPRPRLSDLRDSGGLEQDAGSVAFIWDPARGEDSEKAGTAGL